MKMVGGTGIIGQDMVCGFSNGKYTQFEGTEIVAENCVKAKVKDLVVEGKTIQDTKDLSNIESVTEKEENVLSVINKGKNLIDTSKITRWKDSIYHLEYPLAIKVKENTNYVTNMEMNCIYFLNENNVVIDQAFNNKEGTFKTPIKCKFIQIRTWGTESSKTPIYPEDYAKFQLEEGTVATPYEPYREPSVTTLNLPIPLRSLPNGTCDTIEGNKLVQRVGKVVFSGLEGTGLVWQIDSPYDETLVLYHVLIEEWGGKGVNALKCITSDKFATISNDNWKVNKTKNGCFMNAGGKIHFLVSKEDFPTSTDFDNYLKSNPTTIYYPLADPVIHSLEIPQIQTTKGTNIITTTNNIKPKISMKVKVKK